MYFNYHSKLRKVIKEDKITKIEILDEYNGIKPAMVIYFEKNNPMPIREHMWDDYIKFISELDNKKN